MKPLYAQLALGVITLGIVGGAFFLYGKDFSPNSLSRLASDIRATCASATYRPGCYDTEIPKLMDRGVSMENAFAVTALIQDADTEYFYCHVLGHKLSEKETAKDPSKWTEVIGRCPSGQCSNGCLHGAAQERFRSESLTPDEIDAVLPELTSICSSATRNYTGLEQASCYHSLGHLTMYLTNGNGTDSVDLCDRISHPDGKDFTQVCYEGVYMQVFQPLEPEDFGLVRAIAPTTATEAEGFCDTYPGERRAACYRESWPLYRSLLDIPGELEKFCRLVPGAANENRCFTGMFYVMTAQYNFNEARVTALCDGLSDAYRGQCFANTASRFIETDYRLIDRALGMCTKAQKYGVEGQCYDELLFYASYNFHAGSTEHEQLCSKLPDPWQSACLQREKSTSASRPVAE